MKGFVVKFVIQDEVNEEIYVVGRRAVQLTPKWLLIFFDQLGSWHFPKLLFPVVTLANFPAASVI